MKIVKPTKPIHTSEIVGDQLIINIPVRKDFRKLTFFVIPFIWISCMSIVLLVAFGYGTMDNSNQLGFSFESVLFLFILVVFYAVMSYPLLRNFFGKDIIIISPEHLLITKQTLFIKFKKAFILNEVSNFELYHPTPLVTGFKTMEYVFGKSGSMSFDYGAKTYPFGNEVEPAEGKMIIKIIEDWLGRTE